jgi:biotin carboxyl carrier protein
MNCPNCKNPIKDNSKECEWCGGNYAKNANKNKTKSEIIINCYSCNNPIIFPDEKCKYCNAEITLDNYNLTVIKSEYEGEIFLSRGPDKPPFVKIDDYVNIGKLICIIVTNDLFIEIESEFPFILAYVLVDNASPIEKNQPLFLVRQTNNTQCPNCKNLIQDISSECEWCGFIIKDINQEWDGNTFELFGFDLDEALLNLMKGGKFNEAIAYKNNNSNLDIKESKVYVDNLALKNGLKKSGCFIATACYGDYECAEVKEFRIYRDNVLLKHKIGLLFVEFYYYFSPPIAALISKSEFSKRIIRTLFLRPILNLIKK